MVNLAICQHTKLGAGSNGPIGFVFNGDEASETALTYGIGQEHKTEFCWRFKQVATDHGEGGDRITIQTFLSECQCMAC